jgi:hypothetical protein
LNFACGEISYIPFSEALSALGRKYNKDRPKADRASEKGMYDISPQAKFKMQKESDTGLA